MQPNRASRRSIIAIDISEVAQGSDNPRTSSRQSSAWTSQQRQGSLDQRAARQGTPAAGQGSLDSGSLNPHASQQASINPPVVETGSLDPGSLNQRAARPEARSAEQGSLGVTQPTRVSARITRPWVTRPARCQSTDQRIEHVNSSAGTGSSGRR